MWGFGKDIVPKMKDKPYEHKVYKRTEWKKGVGGKMGLN